MRLLILFTVDLRTTSYKPRRGTRSCSFVGSATHAVHSGEQGCPPVVEDRLLTVVETDVVNTLLVVKIFEGVDVSFDVVWAWDCELSSSSSVGSLGSSVLPGVSGSLGLCPEPPPPVSPPPSGGQKGQIQDGP